MDNGRRQYAAVEQLRWRNTQLVFAFVVGGIGVMLINKFWIGFGDAMVFAAVFAAFAFVQACMGWVKMRRCNALARDEFLQCPTCGYALAHSASRGKCPECGETYDHASIRQKWMDALDTGLDQSLDVPRDTFDVPPGREP